MSKEKKNEEVVVEEKELSDEFVEKKSRGIISRIFNIIITIIIFGWVGIAVIDYINVSQEKQPMFCIEKETKEYEDGQVHICKGLGYKVFEYDRDTIKGLEFGPFWIEEKVEPLQTEE